MRSLAILSKSIALGLGLAMTHATLASVHTLRRPALERQLPGNTLRFEGNGDVVYEFLARDGTIHGRSREHGFFRARWRLHQDDLM